MNELKVRDQYLNDLQRCVLQNPELLPKRGGEIIIPERLIDCGTTMTIRLVCYGSYNAALTVTHDCFNPNSNPEQIPLNFEKRGDDYYTEVTLKFNTPGNTRIEYWAVGERLVRQVAVLDKGYMAVIPWVGDNKPYLDEGLHRYDLPGDYWMPNPELCEDPKETLEKFAPYICNARRFGDRVACFINARTLVPSSESDSLFELSRKTQEKGLKQIKRQMEILGFESMELIASYTPNADTMEILESLAVKGLTSLCAWQNWQDHGWKINHCGVPNQPYYPADDDFRRAGKRRNLMCFTMGNASCNRNYSIMVLDSCPTNIVPGERYLTHRVVNQQMQRFYDAFDSYIHASRNSNDLLTVTVPLESFRFKMDWQAANEAAVRYMVKKAGTEKIVFTSAADVADYHAKRELDMQDAYFFQPDYYYGYHNGTLPGRVADRLEADTQDYLAVIQRGAMLPMYFYDYNQPWDSCLFEDTERNEFGLVDPDVHKPSECYPKQVYTEDMSIDAAFEGDKLILRICSETAKSRMVTGVFDIPFESDFDISFDKKDVTAVKISDGFTGNTHLFIDLGSLSAGQTVITANVTGKRRTPQTAEFIHENLGIMYFNDHAYLRCLDKHAAYQVVMSAPDGAFVRLISGQKVFAQGGVLEFTLNTCWEDEAPILYGYDRELMAKNLDDIHVGYMGQSTCSRWSGQ